MDAECSAIIPARNASEELGPCLAALGHPVNRLVPHEVIVVDDGSTDGTAAVAEAHGARVIRTGGIGPAGARNAGARAASSDLLVFLDSDCVPAGGFLKALLAPFKDPEVAGVRGAYASDQQELVARFVQLELDEKQARLAESSRIAVVDTACAAYRRSVFLEQGGFDDRFPATSAEDVELSFRLSARGERLVYAPGARVYHRHPTRLAGYLRRKLRFGYFRARLYGSYPGRLKEDGYTPRLMPFQIGLAGLLIPAIPAGLLTPLGPWPALLFLLAFLATTLPTVRRGWRWDRRLSAFVPALLLTRSLAQGFGLLAGFAALALSSRPSTGSLGWFGAALSLVAVVVLSLLLANVHWWEMIQPLAAARLELLASAVALAFSVEVAKTVRWQLLLGLGFSRGPGLLGLVLSGRLLNAMAPLRAGDLWRVASVARLERRPSVLAGGSVIAEKLLDAAALGGVSLALLWPAGFNALLAIPAAVALLLGATLLIGASGPLAGRAGMARWVAGAEPLRDGRVLGGAVALTVAGIGLGLAVNLAVLGALGLPGGMAAAAMMLLAGYAAGLVPSGPGQLGVFELAVSAPLMAAGLARGSAVAAALGLHLVLLAMLAVGGLAASILGLVGKCRPSKELDR